MLRKLILAGAFAGAAAAVPVLYENNPQVVDALLRGGDGASEAVPQTPRLSMARAGREAEAEQLTGRRVRLTSDRSGHFGGDFRLNGRTVAGLIDTGATMVAINMSTARQIGIRLGNADFTGSADTANGRTRAAFVMIDRLEIGRISVDDVQAAVLDDKALSGTLIGMTFLSRLRRYQVENGALLLEQ